MDDFLMDTVPLAARSGGLSGGAAGRPPAFKAVGISLAVASGLFIGVSFVLKKAGLLRANVKYNEEAGEGYGYLKNFYWWAGMILMIVGEICNFVAYAFVDAILVTPLGALSVVVTTILSAIFLKERLSFVGKVGCFNCIIGSVVIAMNAPQQSSVSNIQDMKRYAIRPVFLTYAGILILGCAFLAIWAAPRYAKKSMFVYLTICSLIGALSVVATQGLGAAIIAQISGQSQFKEWFLYVLLVFVITTLLTEIIYLNKALNIFNAALVTPTYYVIFTSATIITSAVLFQGFKGSPISITTVVMGFLQICAGVVLLQLSKSAKDVPDAAIFKGDLDQVREVAEQEQPESEPKADAIRGTAAIIRRLSTPRQKMEREEAQRFYNEKELDRLEVPDENVRIEWDGLRRRKTVLSSEGPATPRRTKTLHPPLGMSRFPDYDEDTTSEPRTERSFLGSLRSRTSSILRHPRKPSEQSHPETQPPSLELGSVNENSGKDDVGHQYTEVGSYPSDGLLAPFQYESHKRRRSGTLGSVRFAEDVKFNDEESKQERHSPSTPRSHTSHRQFSFQKFFHRDSQSSGDIHPSEKSPDREHKFFALPHFKHQRPSSHQRHSSVQPTEEEVLGLVKSDTAQTQDTLLNEKSFGDSSKSQGEPRQSSSPPSTEYLHGPKRVLSFAEGDDAQYLSTHTPLPATSGTDTSHLHPNVDNARSLTAIAGNTNPPPIPQHAHQTTLQGRSLPPLPFEQEASEPTSLFSGTTPNIYAQNPNISIAPIPPNPHSIPPAPPSLSSSDSQSGEGRPPTKEIKQKWRPSK